MDATLYFANCQHFKEVLNKVASGTFHTSNEIIKLIILDVSMWIQPDATGILTLREIHKELLKLEIQLAFANAKGLLRDRLFSVKLTQIIGIEYFYESIDSAVNGFRRRRETLTTEKTLTNRAKTTSLIQLNPFGSNKSRLNIQDPDVESPLHTQVTPKSYFSVFNAYGEGI